MWPKGVNKDSLSLTSHYLRIKFEETQTIFATATGFIYEHEDAYYMITNGHNITRINPETKERITNHAGFPDIITTKARISIKDKPGTCSTQSFDIELYEDKDFKKPKWYIHPIHQYNIDVIAIQIDKKENIPGHVHFSPINKMLFDTEFSPEVSDDVFILGYPLDIQSGRELPVWKRGSIATELSILLDDMPKFLVDTATRSGMSGSAVIFRRSGFHKDPSGNAMKNTFGTIQNFIGIYSGRIGAGDNLQAQLGIVWRKDVIEEILESKTIGSIEFQNK